MSLICHSLLGQLLSRQPFLLNKLFIGCLSCPWNFPQNLVTAKVSVYMVVITIPTLWSRSIKVLALLEILTNKDPLVVGINFYMCLLIGSYYSLVSHTVKPITFSDIITAIKHGTQKVKKFEISCISNDDQTKDACLRFSKLHVIFDTT